MRAMSKPSSNCRTGVGRGGNDGLAADARRVEMQARLSRVIENEEGGNEAPKKFKVTSRGWISCRERPRDFVQ